MALLLFLLCINQQAFARSTITVRAIHVENDGAQDHITIQLSRAVTHKAFLIENPNRLVIDLPSFIWKADIENLSQYDGDILSNIRYARFNSSTSRIVFDLTHAVELTDHSAAGGNRKTDELVLTLTSLLTQKADEPAVSDETTGFRDIPTPVTKPNPLGRWKKPLIVIDAGHGGKDTGAIGLKGTLEKQITLRYAKELAEAFEKSGRYRAKLTRSGDRFILLRERVQIARDAGADLFISLHADSAPNIKARGLSVYTLSEDASDKEAAALAEQENKAGIINGFDLTHKNKDVANILIDLAQRDTKNKSITLADHIVDAMRGSVTLLPNTHRYAGFAVLTAPDTPAALIEIGFLSHPKEETLIKQSAYRRKVIAGIVDGVERYFSAQSKN